MNINPLAPRFRGGDEKIVQTYSEYALKPARHAASARCVPGKWRTGERRNQLCRCQKRTAYVRRGGNRSVTRKERKMYNGRMKEISERVYVDSSVVSGMFDSNDHPARVKPFWDAILAVKFVWFCQVYW